MTEPADDRVDIESEIDQWRADLARHAAITAADLAALERRLREHLDHLLALGLQPDEAALIAMKRSGALDVAPRALSQRLWQRLVLSPTAAAPAGSDPSIAWALALGVASAAAFKAPALFGIELESEAGGSFYLRNVCFFVLPFLALYYCRKRDWQSSRGVLIAPFLALAVLVNAYPMSTVGNTEILAALHLPIVLWLTVGYAYVAGAWRSNDRRMDFIRFTGELVIYYVLIALGGGVLTAFTLLLFATIGMDLEWLAANWILPCGAMGAVLICAWLVDAKQSVIGNVAPVLTRVFTPLFALLLLAFMGTMLWTRQGIEVEREMLIGFDLLLVLVLGLLLYAVSARDRAAPPDGFDVLQLVLVTSALVVDLLALAAIAGRISELGFTPNRTAALGMNLVLLVNLGWSARLYLGFLRHREPFASLERWQTGYLPVYGIWAAVVVAVFPPLFGFI